MRAFLFLGLTLMGFALQAQDDCLFTADITTSTGLWGDEVSWTLYTADGDVVAAQDGFESNATSTTTACLEDSCYVLEMLDTFGDGWNGAEVTISLPVLGLELGAYTLESGDYQALSIGFGDCPDNNWTGSGGGNGGGNGGGVVDTYGCMDPAASNYDSAATIHCCCEYDVDCTGSNTLAFVESGGIDSVFFGWFLQYAVVGTNGLPWNPTFTGVNDAGQWVTEGCIADGCYNVTVYNSFSTEPVSVDVLLNGEVIDTYTLTPGEYQFDTALGINVDDCAPFVLGCTDPEAPNYNADATIDNGTCLEPCDCPDVFEPVCGYDYYSGVTMTFNNLCELECAGAYFQWEGDCADIPVYGCMDPEALNYDPNATLDNGYCQYIPECGEDHLVVVASSVTGLDSLNGNIFGGGLSGYFTGMEGYVDTFIGVYDVSGNYTAYGCMADGCYNFYVNSSGWVPGGSMEITVDGGDPTSFVLGADEFGAVFPFGLGVDDCEVYIPGCTDPEALNYHPDATEDDGSCQYPFTCPDDQVAATMYVCTFSGGDEVGLTITDSQGNVIYDQQGYPNLTIDYFDICLDPEECYTATMTNLNGGTSWNGGYFWIHAGNVEWVNGSLEGASSAEITFGTGEDCEGSITPGGNDFTFGCTDPQAINYNPLATFDDGSCEYEDNPGGGGDLDSLDCGDGLNLVAGIFISGDPFLSEVAWALLDEDSAVVMAGSGNDIGANGVVNPVQACLPDGCYTLELYDSFGDGWGGGILILSAGNEALTFTLDLDFASFPFNVGDGCGEILTITGCTDAGALNYNPDADEDDGSCEFAFCPEVEVTFVTYTFGNGDEVSWTMDGTDESTGETLSMTSDGFSDNSVHTHTTCMVAGCYGMTLHDAGGDGWDQGWLEIWVDGALLTTGTYQANGVNAMDFGVGVTCGDDPEVGGTITNAGMSGWNDGVDFSPYPTPTGEIVNVLGTGFDNESPVVVRIRDGIGRIVRTREVLPGQGPQGWVFDVHDWSAGIYTVEGLQGQRRARARFIVAR